MKFSSAFSTLRRNDIVITRLEYTSFVRSRVKQMPTLEDNLLHAAVGLIGEVVEFMAAGTQKQSNEELGDCEFYLEAAYQAIEKVDFQVQGKLGEKDGTQPLDEAPSEGMLLQCAATLLDLAKKAWAYRKPVASMPIQEALGLCVTALNRIYSEQHLSAGSIRKGNYDKLILRYPVGYTDAAAQARADKEPVNG